MYREFLIVLSLITISACGAINSGPLPPPDIDMSGEWEVKIEDRSGNFLRSFDIEIFHQDANGRFEGKSDSGYGVKGSVYTRDTDYKSFVGMTIFRGGPVQCRSWTRTYELSYDLIQGTFANGTITAPNSEYRSSLSGCWTTDISMTVSRPGPTTPSPTTPSPLCAPTTVPTPAPTPNTYYSIGNMGPAGGIVFNTTDGGLHGLEAAPEDHCSNAEWGCLNVSIVGADETAIGTGAQNTADILAVCTTPGTAAAIADAYTLNGYTDWFLPSQDELNLLYQQKSVVGGFASTKSAYWSSSEVNGSSAWLKTFNHGYQYYVPKNITLGVRAVRAF